MKKLTAALLAAALVTPAHSIDWVCSVKKTTRKQSERTAPRKVERYDLQQAYTGQPVLLGNTWLLAVMLPADHPTSKDAFAQIGVSPEAAQRLAEGTSLVDRGIRVVRTPEQMLTRIANNPPAIGYVGFFPGGEKLEPCF